MVILFPMLNKIRLKLRIEIHILSLLWMMKNISCFKTLAVKLFRLLGNIKIANVSHHPVQASVMIFNPYIYILHAIPKDQIFTRRLYKECHWGDIRFRYRLQKGKKTLYFQTTCFVHIF